MEIIIIIIMPYVFSKVNTVQRNLNTELIRKYFISRFGKFWEVDLLFFFFLISFIIKITNFNN